MFIPSRNSKINSVSYLFWVFYPVSNAFNENFIRYGFKIITILGNHRWEQTEKQQNDN